MKTHKLASPAKPAVDGSKDQAQERERRLADQALKNMSRRFDAMYAKTPLVVHRDGDARGTGRIACLVTSYRGDDMCPIGETSGIELQAVGRVLRRAGMGHGLFGSHVDVAHAELHPYYPTRRLIHAAFGVVDDGVEIR